MVKNNISIIILLIALWCLIILIFFQRKSYNNITEENIILKEQIKNNKNIIDSYQNKIIFIDNQIDSILQQREISREIHKTYPVYKYQQYQIDSFFKNRYYDKQ